MSSAGLQGLLFKAKAAAGALFGLLGVVTIFWRDWIVSAAREYWLWHSFRDAVRRVEHVVDVASVIMCAVRS